MSINCFFCGHSLYPSSSPYVVYCLHNECYKHSSNCSLVDDKINNWLFYTINYRPIYLIDYNLVDQKIYIENAEDIAFNRVLIIDNPNNIPILTPDNWKQKLPTLLTFI